MSRSESYLGYFTAGYGHAEKSHSHSRSLHEPLVQLSSHRRAHPSSPGCANPRRSSVIRGACAFHITRHEGGSSSSRSPHIERPCCEAPIATLPVVATAPCGLTLRPGHQTAGTDSPDSDSPEAIGLVPVMAVGPLCAADLSRYYRSEMIHHPIRRAAIHAASQTDLCRFQSAV